jgi:hypothetical protein
MFAVTELPTETPGFLLSMRVTRVRPFLASIADTVPLMALGPTTGTRRWGLRRHGGQRITITQGPSTGTRFPAEAHGGKAGE